MIHELQVERRIEDHRERRRVGPRTERGRACADVGMALCALGLICSRNPLIGAAITTTMPLSWVIWKLTRRRAINAQHHVWMTMERFTSRTVDTFVELRSVRLAGSTERFVDGLTEDFDAFVASQRDQRVATAVPAAKSTLLFASLSGVMLSWLGGNGISGRATVGDLVLVVGTIGRFMGPAQHIPARLANVTLAIDAVRRVHEVLQRPNETNRGRAYRDWTADGTVELRHASLHHGGRSHALIDVSLRVEPGETVAFVGRDGFGKDVDREPGVRLLRP